MEYINDINVNEAVLHILDGNAGEPILNEYLLDLGEDTYRFLYKHIEKCLKDEELKYAKFNEERSIVKEVTQDYLNGIDNDLIGLSKELARQMFAIMNGNTNIPSCDLIVASIVTDKGPMIAILKMDYIKNFTHKVNFIDNKIGIGIVPQLAGLPGSSQKLSKAAFIKPIRKEEKYNLMVLDKQRKKLEEYGANYWNNNFLEYNVITNERDSTKALLTAVESWTRDMFSEDADQAEKVRTKLKNKMIEEDVIKVDELANDLFKHEEFIKKDFKDFIKMQGVEDVKVDKVYVEKKIEKRKLKLENEIDLTLPNEIYNDSSKFEILKNGDGSVNILIKHIKNYIEK